VENFFKIFYDYLDQQRNEMLKDEYSIQKQMIGLEEGIRNFLQRA
jgi:hypothetical protein